MEEKTYVFGNDQNALLAGLMNNNGFGGGCGAWWVIILMALIWGRNGFGGNGDYGQVLQTLNGDTGRELLAQGIQGNQAAISQLASTLNCDVNAMTSALATLNNGINTVGNQVGMSGMQVINSIQSGNMTLANQISQCCCDNKLLVTNQGFENRIAISDQTNTLGTKIDNQTSLINEHFSQLELRALQDKIEMLREANTNLRGQIDNANQTAAIQGYINNIITPVANDVAALKAAAPPTVAVPYPQLTAVPNSVLYGYGPYGNGSIWS